MERTATERPGQHRGQGQQIIASGSYLLVSWLLSIYPFLFKIYLLLQVYVPAYPSRKVSTWLSLPPNPGSQLLFALHFGILTWLEAEADSETRI